MKIKVNVSTNKVGSMVSRTIEIDDEDHLTEEEIEQIAQEKLFEMISWDFEVQP